MCQLKLEQKEVCAMISIKLFIFISQTRMQTSCEKYNTSYKMKKEKILQIDQYFNKILEQAYLKISFHFQVSYYNIDAGVPIKYIANKISDKSLKTVKSFVIYNIKLKTCFTYMNMNKISMFKTFYKYSKTAFFIIKVNSNI